MTKLNSCICCNSNMEMYTTTNEISFKTNINTSYGKDHFIKKEIIYKLKCSNKNCGLAFNKNIKDETELILEWNKLSNKFNKHKNYIAYIK